MTGEPHATLLYAALKEETTLRHGSHASETLTLPAGTRVAVRHIDDNGLARISGTVQGQRRFQAHVRMDRLDENV